VMCGIAVVVVGQEPLGIHVTPDSDDIPWQNVASSRFSFRAQEFTHGSHTVISHVRYTPTASSRNEDVLHRAKCDAILRVFVIRVVSRRAPTRLHAFSWGSKIDLGFSRNFQPNRADVQFRSELET